MWLIAIGMCQGTVRPTTTEVQAWLSFGLRSAHQLACDDIMSDSEFMQGNRL